MALGLLDTIAVSLLVLVVVGMASIRVISSARNIASVTHCMDKLLGLGHGDVVRGS